MPSEKKQDTEPTASTISGPSRTYLLTDANGQPKAVKARSQNEAVSKLEKAATDEGSK